jgi:hypothetical protein
MQSEERTVRIEAIRVRRHRTAVGSCLKLAQSIDTEGLRRAVTVWKDGTLISGERRVFAHMLLKREAIQAVFVDTVEDAAKRMIGDNDDALLEAHSGGNSFAKPMQWTEVCRLWETLRRLDAPAAARRAYAAKQRGTELRKKTQAGLRRPGRASERKEDYLLSVVCEPFSIKSATARRVERIYNVATGVVNAPDEKAELARKVMKGLDAGTVSIWEAYTTLNGSQRVYQPTKTKPTPAAAAAKQLATWERALPQLEGLTEGLTAVGAPNPDLTWEQVGPVHARLAVVRRGLEKIIRQMKEINQS